MGSACGIASWLACTQIMSGSISVATAGLNAPLLTGSILSVGVSAILLPIISLIAPCKPFDWEELNTKITTTEDTVRCRRVLTSFEGLPRRALQSHSTGRSPRPKHHHRGHSALPCGPDPL